jgi:Rieske Fe-S protein
MSTPTRDCACHGSKFDRLGEVIVGPANTGLSEVEPQRVARTGS